MSSPLKLIETADGSSTLYHSVLGDHYHSLHGAETESSYVFIEKGLKYCADLFQEISVLEVGMGTGLNLCLTYDFHQINDQIKMNYTALEPFPLEEKITKSLKYSFLEEESTNDFYKKMHESEWNMINKVSENFSFIKLMQSLQEAKLQPDFNLIYYDAFGPTFQSDMWDAEIIKKVCSLMREEAILVSYCAQGQFRRNLEACGLMVERLPGPPGKREMIRAIKH